MRNVLLVLGVAVLLGGGYYFFTKNNVADENENVLTEGDVINEVVLTQRGIGVGTAVFYGNGTMRLMVDGVFYNLTQVRTASGIRYESDDSEVVYQEHQGEIVVITPEMTYDQIEIDADIDMTADTSISDANGVVYEVIVEGEAVATVEYAEESIEVEYEGVIYTLIEVEDADPDTVRYESTDGSLAVTEDDTTITIEENGEVIYSSVDTSVEAAVEMQ